MIFINKERRAALRKAKQVFEQGQEMLADVIDKEDEAFADLPENLQESYNGIRMQDAISYMDDAERKIRSAMDDLDMILES